MARYPLLEYLDYCLEQIAKKQNEPLEAKYALLPVLPQRKDRWFPDNDFGNLKYWLKPDQYRRIRRTLQDARDCRGKLCLRPDQLEKLDNLYDEYRHAAELDIDRVGERVPKQIFSLKKSYGVADGETDRFPAFRALLARAVMEPFWRGDTKSAYLNLKVLRADLHNDAGFLKAPQHEKILWDDMALGVGGFCVLVETGEYLNRYTIPLIDRNNKKRNGFRTNEIYQLRHFANPRSEFASKVYVALESGDAGEYGISEGAFIRIRAACSAIERGFSGQETLSFLNGKSVDDLMEKGLDELGDMASLQARLNCEAFAVRAYALKGMIEETFIRTNSIRGRCLSEKLGPHLEAMLIINEGLALKNS
jgi:hypothetical protein